MRTSRRSSASSRKDVQRRQDGRRLLECVPLLVDGENETMRIAVFSQSLLSDWNHGNAHFLRGVVTELGRRGHRVTTYEPRDSRSLQNLVADQGEASIEQLWNVYPPFKVVRYDLETL